MTPDAEDPMSLEEKIHSGTFALLAEFEPPKGSDFSDLLSKANLVKGRIDTVVVPEMGNAVMKCSSLGGCAFLQTQGFETLMQVCCRDRNRLALQGDLLAAGGIGIRNIMAVTGDDITFGDHRQARAVYDLDVHQLLGAIQELQQGKDLAGIQLQGHPRFFVGSTFNAGAAGGALEVELEELQKKVEYGVQFVVTTPVFDPGRLDPIMKRIDPTKVALIPTVLLLKSAGMARYIDRNIRSISIPPDMITSIQKAPDKVRRCIQIAAETIGQLKKMNMPGVLISPLGWEDKLPQVLDQAKL
jgi:5,10-methylenetetrahydrofolate reductase